jgi:Arc/MetJ-type ribon-helix-helix transcriptional regulator
MSTSGVPDAPDESCRHRETVRLPRSTAHEIQRLVDEGAYPNRSAAIRAGVRLLIRHESSDAIDPASATADETGPPGEGR